MKNNLNKILLLILIIPTVLYSQRQYTPNQTVYCWAKSGLNLRKQPSTNSDKVTKIPFKGSVTVIDTMKGKSYSDVLTNDSKYPLTINGNWLKVSYKSKSGDHIDTGYVFDGYLSRIYPQSLDDYFLKNYIKTVDTTMTDYGQTFKCSYKLYRKKNGDYYKHIDEGGRWSHDYYFPNLSFEEAVMFMMLSFPPDDIECPLKIIKIDGSDYFFESCTVTTVRLISIMGSGISIYTYETT